MFIFTTGCDNRIAIPLLHSYVVGGWQLYCRTLYWYIYEISSKKIRIVHTKKYNSIAISSRCIQGRIVQKGQAVLRVIRWMSFSKASPSTVFSSTCDSESLRSHSRQIGVAKELSTFYEPCSCCVIGSRTIIYGHRKKVFPFFFCCRRNHGHLSRGTST